MNDHESETEVFYDYSRQRNAYGVQVMKNGLFVGAPIWVKTEEEAKQKVEEIKKESA